MSPSRLGLGPTPCVNVLSEVVLIAATRQTLGRHISLVCYGNSPFNLAFVAVIHAAP